MILDKADLAGIVIHKWVPMHGTYFIQRFCPQISAPGTARAGPVQLSTGIWLMPLQHNAEICIRAGITNPYYIVESMKFSNFLIGVMLEQDTLESVWSKRRTEN